MSVHSTPEGKYKVRWREGGRNRSRTFSRKRDAEAYDAEVKRRRQLGPIAVQMLDAGSETLDEYVAKTFAPGHMAHLRPKTARRYAGQYRKHIQPYLGAVPLRDLTVDSIAKWQGERLRAGVGAVGVAKASTLLGSILQRALEGGRIPSNPQRLVKKPKRGPKQEVRPLAPESVEAMRAHVLNPPALKVDASNERQRPRRAYVAPPKAAKVTRQRDATLLSVLGYGGLRPGEALDLHWAGVHERTMVISASKTAEYSTGLRTVRLLAALREDLEHWRAVSPSPSDHDLVFPGPDGKRWSEEAYNSWRRRTFKAAVKAAGRPDVTRPYDLRHSFASLLLHEGRSVIYVARQLGHSATLTLSTYGHVIEELEDAPRMKADDAIACARRNLTC